MGLCLPISLKNKPAPVADSEDDRPPTSDSVVRSAGLVSIAVFMSRITGLVREMVMAGLFGAGPENDAFNLGFRIPNLTRDLFAEGALSSAFVPTFTNYLTTKSKAEAARLANLVATALILVVGGMCVLGVIFAPLLVNIMGGGFHSVPGKFEMAVNMTRIMFPFLLLVALAAQAMGVLNACNQFGVPAMASTFFNIGSVAFGLIVGYVVGPRIGISHIQGMGIGVVLGGALQLFWQVPSLMRNGFRFRPELDWSHPGVVHIMQLMGPAILGNAATQINVMVNTNFASHTDGAVTWLNCAFRFMQLPLGIFGVAIASATLPFISRSASLGKMDEFRRTLSRSLGMVFLLTIPSSIGLAVLGRSIIGSIYEIGRFKQSDTDQTAVALSCYALGLAGYAALKVLSPSFYALGDARTPMVVSLLSVLINFGFAWSLTNYTRLGHAGLALSTSAVALFGFVVQFWIIRNRIGGIYGRSLVNSVGKVLIASAAMGFAVWASSHLMQAEFGVRRAARLADLAVSIPLGLGVFYAFSRALKLSDLDSAVASITGPLLRRLKRA